MVVGEPVHLAGYADLNSIRSRTLVMIGDDDEVTLEHAIALYRALADGDLAVIPRTSQGLLVEKPTLCNTILDESGENGSLAIMLTI